MQCLCRALSLPLPSACLVKFGVLKAALLCWQMLHSNSLRVASAGDPTGTAACEPARTWVFVDQSCAADQCNLSKDCHNSTVVPISECPALFLCKDPSLRTQPSLPQAIRKSCARSRREAVKYAQAVPCGCDRQSAAARNAKLSHALPKVCRAGCQASAAEASAAEISLHEQGTFSSDCPRPTSACHRKVDDQK